MLLIVGLGYPYWGSDQTVLPDANTVSVFLAIGYISWILVTSFFYLLGYVATVRGSVLALNGASQVTFADLWQAGLTYFWRAAGLFLLLILIYLILFLPMILITVLTAGIGIFCLFPFMLIFGFSSYAITNLCLAVLTNADGGLTATLKNVWSLLRQHIWKIVLAAVLLMVVQMLATSIIYMPLMALQLLALPWFSGSLTGSEPDVRSIFQLMSAIMILIMPFFMAMQTLILTHGQIAWVLVYRNLFLHTNPK
jgi:hypothetical protein